MRRFALVLVAVGCVLLGVTIVVASQPARAPARSAPVSGVRHPLPRALTPLQLPALLRRRLPTHVAPAFARPRLRHLRPLRAPAVPALPGSSCEVGPGGCSLHPCVTYIGAKPACVFSAPAARLASESPASAVAARSMS